MRDLYKSPTWTLQLLGFKDTLNLPDLRVRRPTFCKRPFLMSWRWCLHEALPYAHQTNMSWKHSPTHGLTAFKGKAKKKIWNEQRKLWKNAKKHTVCEHKLIHDIVSSIYTKTTTDFFSTTDCGWNGFYKMRIYTSCFWTQITRIERIYVLLFVVLFA